MIGAYICRGLLVLYVLASLPAIIQEFGYFLECLKWAIGLWILWGALVLFYPNIHMTFEMWLFGGGILFFCLMLAWFDFCVYVVIRLDHNPRERKPKKEKTPVIFGEVMDEYPELEPNNPQAVPQLKDQSYYPWSILEQYGPAFPIDEILIKRECSESHRNHVHYVVKGKEFCEDL